MVAFVMLVAVLALVAVVVSLTTSKDRYAQMTEEEFEAEAKRSSLLGAAVMEMHKFLQPTRVEYMRRRDKRVEADSTEAGEPPPKEPPAR